MIVVDGDLRFLSSFFVQGFDDGRVLSNGGGDGEASEKMMKAMTNWWRGPRFWPYLEAIELDLDTYIVGSASL
ncbi:hypothetical protein K1719_000649 [Acacia pycnantha]|nr:hypothetical protein K1719_000649 [Acacia pycnantha]